MGILGGEKVQEKLSPPVIESDGSTVAPSTVADGIGTLVRTTAEDINLLMNEDWLNLSLPRRERGKSPDVCLPTRTSDTIAK